MAKKKKSKKTEQQPVGEAAISRCRKCSSTRRSDYTSTRTVKANGCTVIFQTCRCLECGQVRTDKSVV